MRIGVICRGCPTSEKTAEIEKIADFGAVEVYAATIGKCGKKRRFLREIKKCVSHLRRIGISLCVGAEEFLPIRRFGIELFCDDSRILKIKAAEAAREFALANVPEPDYLISGGSAADVLKTSRELLRFCKTVCVEHMAFDEIADAVFCDTGAIIRREAPLSAIRINLGEGKFITYGNFGAEAEDFRVSFCGNSLREQAGGDLRRLASMLEISGFLRQNEIKVEYYPKKTSGFTNFLLDNST